MTRSAFPAAHRAPEPSDLLPARLGAVYRGAFRIAVPHGVLIVVTVVAPAAPGPRTPISVAGPSVAEHR